MWSFQPEILDYLKGVTDKYGLRRYVQFNSLVDRAHWDDDEMRWHVFTADGREYVAQFLVSGAGGLHIPLIPEFEGSTNSPGRRVPFRAVGPRRRPHRQAGRGHRHRRQRHPDRARDRRGRRRTAALPTHPAVGDAAAQQRHPGVDARGSFTDVPGTAGGDAGRRSTGLHEAVGFGMTKQPKLLKIGELLGKWNIRRSVKDRELRRKLTPELPRRAASES